MTQHRTERTRRAAAGPASRWLHLLALWTEEVEPHLVLGRDGRDRYAPGRCIEVMDSDVRRGGTDPNGSPTFNFYPMKWRQAYRASWVLSRLADPTESYTKILGQVWVLHRACNNPLCVNPNHVHLRPKAWVNAESGERHRAHGNESCANHDTKLNRNIMALYEGGMTVGEIALELGLTSTTVSHTVRTWVDPDALLSMGWSHSKPEVLFPLMDSELRTLPAPALMERMADVEWVGKNKRRKTRVLLSSKPAHTEE